MFGPLVRRWLIAISLPCALAPVPSFAADAASVDVPVLDAPPSMNGTIDATWAKAAKVTLDTDYNYRRAASEPTTVYVAQDGAFLDFAFVATQHEAQNAVQETNSSSVFSEDYVGVYLYPQGTTGISYSFEANPHGARYQTSSENTAYSPQWTAAGKSTSDGYVVTMRIPLAIIRSGGSTKWTAQFVRSTVATGGFAVWTYDSREGGPEDPAHGGRLTNIGAALTAKVSSRPKARLQLYGLSQSTSVENGGSTSRVGADFSVPVSPTASFVGTLHPDYSNVEVDQQTIAPNAFARQYAEVRPFFTQVASYFGETLSCSNCPQTLYTPSIPTFAQGYALEGTQGRLNFAAFDAIGDQRNDDAETMNYNFSGPNSGFSLDLQRVGVSLPGLNDVTTTFDTGYMDTRTHLFEYLNTGFDRGTNVTDPGDADYLETGLGYADTTSVIVANLQNVGSQYQPVDGYVAQPDIYGYELFGRKQLNFTPMAPLRDVSANVFYARYNTFDDQLAQTQGSAQVNFDFKDLLTLHVYTGTTGVRVSTGEFLPFQNNGALLGYRINTPTPDYVAYTGGSYYHGELDAWNYLATIPLARKVHLSLETDENQYLTSWPGEESGRQWLERAGIDWQFSRFASFDAGMRRIIGPNLPNSFEPYELGPSPVCIANPYNPGCFVNAGNVTLAFHYLLAKNEFYIVYGDANNLSTEPSLFLKWIRYIGAEKGT